MRFVELLASQGRISKPEAASLLDAENQEPAWFGTLAFLFGWIERQDIDRVLRHQRHTGLRFGEQALHMGLLSLEQRTQVERLQMEHKVLFTEVAWALENLDSRTIASSLTELLSTSRVADGSLAGGDLEVWKASEKPGAG